LHFCIIIIIFVYSCLIVVHTYYMRYKLKLKNNFIIADSHLFKVTLSTKSILINPVSILSLIHTVLRFHFAQYNVLYIVWYIELVSTVKPIYLVPTRRRILN